VKTVGRLGYILFFLLPIAFLALGPVMLVFEAAGYILFFLLPVAGVSAPFLVGMAWYRMGHRWGAKLFKANGVSMFLTSAASATYVAIVFAKYFMNSPDALVLIVGNIERAVPMVFSAMLSSMLYALIALVLYLVSFFLEIYTHSRAAELYGNKWFRRGAWIRKAIIHVAAVAYVYSIIILASYGLSIARLDLERVVTLNALPLLPIVVGWLLGVIFSFIAFSTLEEKTPQQS